jgi:hypothetical protein
MADAGSSRQGKASLVLGLPLTQRAVYNIQDTVSKVIGGAAQ